MLSMFRFFGFPCAINESFSGWKSRRRQPQNPLGGVLRFFMGVQVDVCYVCLTLFAFGYLWWLVGSSRAICGSRTRVIFDKTSTEISFTLFIFVWSIWVDPESSGTILEPFWNIRGLRHVLRGRGGARATSRMTCASLFKTISMVCVDRQYKDIAAHI